MDLGESFQTHIYLQNLASIQPRTSPLKFARSSNAVCGGGPPPGAYGKGCGGAVLRTGRGRGGGLWSGPTNNGRFRCDC